MKTTATSILRTPKASYALLPLPTTKHIEGEFYVVAEDQLSKKLHTVKCAINTGNKDLDIGRKTALTQEAQLLVGFSQPSIAQCCYAGRALLETSGRVTLVQCIVLEPLPKKSLLDLVRESVKDSGHPLLLATVKTLFAALVQAIIYLHLKGVAYGNVSLEEILVSDDLKSVKLYNFGKATLSRSDSDKNSNESEDRPSPETAQAADVYALGLVLFGLQTGRCAFDSTEGSQWKRLFYSPWRLYYWQGIAQQVPNISVHFINLINGLLEADPAKRIIASQILKHSYFVQ